MLYRQIEGPERKVRGGKGTVRDMINIDAPGASKLRPLFAAEDTMAAFEKAKKEKRKGKFISRKDIENRAAADIRDIRKTGSVNFAQQIINDPATQKALSDAQEYIAAKRGASSSIAQSAQADEARRKKAMSEMKAEMKALYPDLQYANPDKQTIDQILKEQGVFSPYTLGYGMQQMQPGIGDMRYNEDVAYDEIRNIINKDIDERIKSQQMENLMGGAANFAGGGIAKLAGVDQGPPPESGPMSQGLRSLYNNGRKL
jgi:hypothetical protein